MARLLVGRGRLQQPRVLALGDHAVDGAGVPRGRHDDVGLGGRHHLVGGGVVDRPVERHDAAERRLLVALVGEAVGGGDVARHRGAARVGVLDDGDRGLLAEVMYEEPRGFGVVEVEVGELEARVLPHPVPPAGAADLARLQRGL